MRTIKFRAKTKSTNEWVDGSYIYAHKWHGSGAAGHLIADIYGCDKVEIDINTLGQFTGLYDKNRKDIYEGDIVSISGITYGVINYLNEYAMFNIDYGNSGKPMAVDLLNPKDYYLEVVGNIYDNPELLKGV